VVRDTAGLDGTAANLSTATRQLREGASRQLDETAYMVEAMQQMTAAIDDVAGHADRAAQAAQGASRKAGDGRLAVSGVRNEIGTLAEHVEGTDRVVQDLAAQAEQIDRVLEVIRNIAEQTNLLALNAAIEAARAGEQGRGFAVVADEVRQLASRTSMATADIQTMIAALQAGTRQAVDVMQRSREQAEHSVSHADRAEHSLSDINNRVNEISAMSNQIAAAVGQQSSASEEISQGIVSIRGSSDQHVSSGMHSQRSASGVAQLADGMLELVQQFWARRRA